MNSCSCIPFIYIRKVIFYWKTFSKCFGSLLFLSMWIYLEVYRKALSCYAIKKFLAFQLFFNAVLRDMTIVLNIFDIKKCRKAAGFEIFIH